MIQHLQRIGREPPAYAYDGSLAPRLVVAPGASVVIETHDAREGTLGEHPGGTTFTLPPAPLGRANPLTGPLVVEGAEPGDRLLVTVERIAVAPRGWVGVLDGVGPAAAGRSGVSLGRACAVAGGQVALGHGLAMAAGPLIGCLGTAPAGAPPASHRAGRFGGNLDHGPLGSGARVHLPVAVAGAGLFVGDVHAVQGDGELSGFGLEIAAEVTLTVALEQGTAPAWPWLETGARVMVLCAGESFEAAREAAVETMLDACGTQLGLARAEGLALLSLVGDLRLGQAFGGEDTTVRLELPAGLGIRPQ